MSPEMKKALSWRTNRYARRSPAAFYKNGRHVPRKECMPPWLFSESCAEFRARLGMGPLCEDDRAAYEAALK